MIRKKNSFFTFIWSMLPGAGHMYMGLLKQGVSLMILFFGITFIGSWLEIGPSVLMALVVWFYSFFDCWNKRAMSDEEFYQLEDQFFWGIFDDKDAMDKIKQNGRIKAWSAVGLIFLGLMILWDNFWNILCMIFPERWMEWIVSLVHSAPKTLFAIVIIYIGIRMIAGKKKELDQIEQNDWKKEEK